MVDAIHQCNVLTAEANADDVGRKPRRQWRQEIDAIGKKILSLASAIVAEGHKAGVGVVADRFWHNINQWIGGAIQSIFFRQQGPQWEERDALCRDLLADLAHIDAAGVQRHEPDNEPTPVGNAARTTQDITQAEFARMTGLSNGTVSKWAKKGQPITLEAARQYLNTGKTQRRAAAIESDDAVQRKFGE